MDKERQMKCCLWVVGVMNGFKDEGLLSGGYEMTDEGRKQYQELIDSGFEPTDEEIDTWAKFIFHSAGTEMADQMLS